MAEKIKCTSCTREMYENECIEVESKFYCDTYCLYYDNASSPYLGVPADAMDLFSKKAAATVAMRAAQAMMQEAR